MKDKKIKRIRKKELLETLLKQKDRIEELEKELKLANKKLLEKKIILENSGSIAKASLELNNIFALAQKSADEYLKSIKEKEKLLDKKLESLEKSKRK